MLPPAVVEQQAKLGVSAEESKSERIKRQQARFRDRGGAFVPSTSNPLVDILLARTVSGESPSKAHRKDVTAKRLSPAKARQTAVRKAGAATTSDESQDVAGNGKLAVSQKRKKKAPELLGDNRTEKQRSGKQAKGRKKVQDTELGAEQPPSNTKSKSTSKRKSKQPDTSTAPSNSGSNAKPRPKTKAKSNPTKTVAAVPVSDDDRMAVDVRSKAKSNIRQNGNDGESDVEAPIVGKSTLPPMDGTKNMVRAKEKNTDKRSSGKKIENAGNRKGKDRANPNQDASEPIEDDEQPAECFPKPRKRKKEDNHDDRPRKTVKFSDTSPAHPLSRDLKENQSDKIQEIVTKSRIKDDLDAHRLKLAVKLPSRAKRSKGPPRQVLERIKASVERHLHCADSDPDELDCLS